MRSSEGCLYMNRYFFRLSLRLELETSLLVILLHKPNVIDVMGLLFISSYDVYILFFYYDITLLSCIQFVCDYLT